MLQDDLAKQREKRRLEREERRKQRDMENNDAEAERQRQREERRRKRESGKFIVLNWFVFGEPGVLQATAKLFDVCRNFLQLSF